MKQYLSVVIVFVVCLLAILGAWIWRISQRTSIDTNTSKDVINKTINVYQDNVNIYE